MNGEILVEEGKIAGISEQSLEGFTGETLDGQGNFAFPGFIDLHITRCCGADFMDGEEAAFAKIARSLPKEGTTSFLATTLTESAEKIQRAIHCGITVYAAWSG